MTAHTPAPWSVHSSDDHNGARIDGPNGRAVAHAIQRDEHPAIGQGITQAEAEANGRLIAAAPELLDAARAVVARWDSPDWSDGTHTGDYMHRLRCAITKAAGGGE
jgi:hypothetical protein